MNIEKVINWIRHECLSYQLPKDRQKFDDEKGEVLDFLENVLHGDIRGIVRVKVIASNEEVIDELAKEIKIVADSRKFDKGSIRVISTQRMEESRNQWISGQTEK